MSEVWVVFSPRYKGWSWRDTPDFHEEWAREGIPDDEEEKESEDDIDWDFIRELQEDR